MITVQEFVYAMMVLLEMTALDWNVPTNAVEMEIVIMILESALAMKVSLEMTALD